VQPKHAWWALGIGSAAVLAVAATWPGVRAQPTTPHLLEVEAASPDAMRLPPADRLDALRRALVWRSPHARGTVPLVAWTADGAADEQGPIECRFLPSAPSGTTTKFDCVLEDGSVIKVKYGSTPEIQAEVAASRLLAHLGFGADDVMLAPRVRCFGCPRRPFEVSKVVWRLPLGDRLLHQLPTARVVDFEWAAVERRFPGRTIETDLTEGWAWFELQSLAPADAALQAQRDALALSALLLAHWDNKASNQRLVCLDAVGARPENGCAEPFAIIHDLGATFGPNKVNLARWSSVPVWTDARQCTGDMRDLPYHGGTFIETAIGERGRQLLLRELSPISAADAQAWFESARFENADAWAAAFLDKVRQIREAGPCPEETRVTH
jgi:hypothetical protein